jgi:hypothetical protein
MAEAGATAEGTVEKPVVETQVETPVVETHDDADHEPGGDSPQEIRARKEYRLRKRLEAEVFELQNEKAATNARLKTLEEVTKQQATPKTRVYTTQELQAAVDAGTISVVEAADYLAEQRAKQTADRVLKQERVRDDEATRQSRAQEQIDKYVEVAPWLKDKYDARRKPLESEYARLIDTNGFYRLPDSVVTEALLLEKTLGSLDQFKAKMRLDKSSGSNTQFHVEGGAGGGTTTTTTTKTDASKLPPHVTDYLNKSGMNAKDRESYTKSYLEKRGQK